MKLLLLISALLSALTGAGTATRAPQVAVAVARSAEAVVAAQAKPALVAGLRNVVLPPLAQSATSIVGRAWRIAPAAPLYLSRRRE